MLNVYEHIKFNVVFCKQKSFDSFYGNLVQDFEESFSYTSEDFCREWQSIQNKVREDLAKYWTEDFYGDEDFALMDNYNYTFHKAGTIYSKRIICREFVQIIINAINSEPNRSQWIFHFSCEVDSTYNEFFIKNSQVYLCGQSEIARHLQKSKIKPVSLHRSVELDRLDWAQKMYKPGVFYRPVTRDAKGNHPQHYLKSIALADFLHDRGFDFNERNSAGLTVLDKVIGKDVWQYSSTDFKGDLPKFLISKGAKTSFELDFPLHFSCLLGTANDTRLKLADNDVCSLDSFLNAPPLIYAIRSGHISKVKLLLKNGADITQKAIDGDSVLLVAYNFNASLNMLKLLIANNAGINFSSSMYNNAPLLHLFCKKTPEHVDLLLKAGADINRCDNDGNTAAFYAEGEDGVAVLKMLHAKGLDFSVKNHEGKTCVNHFAEWVEYFSYDQKISARYMSLALAAQELSETPIHVSIN